MKSSTLYYVHDPMCSWCWGFQKTWKALQISLPKEVQINYVLGGLAPDSNEPMSGEMRNYIQSQWRKIEQRIPGTVFNHDFWHLCQPRRSTYPACRAVIATKNQNPMLEVSMIRSIQQAYYLQAKNPSDDTTLIALAKELDLDVDQFTQDLHADNTQQQLLNDLQLAQDLGVNSFPSLVFASDQQRSIIQIDYNDPQPMLAQILT